MTMASNVKHADDSELQLLVFGDEGSEEYRLAAAHVETCRDCQSRLSRIAGPAEFEDEASSILDGYWATDALLRDARAATANRSESQDFLSPPSHPEMLGRLGRYEIERVIGSGGMGVVLKGFDTELNRPVAIKVLARHLAHSGAARQRFARESRAAAAIVHEHVVAIHNVETDGEIPFLVMQFVAGESLQSRVDRDGPLDAKETLRIGIQAAAGLAAAHEQGVVHRDVKPANILLESGVERILLTDFGLARTVDDASLTHTGIVTGTPHYMSPEQANGETTDSRTDLFSLGSVLYFMATGRPPFRADRAMGVLHRICHDKHRPTWQVNADIPDELSDIIDRLLEKKPSRRFSSALQVKESLARLLANMQQRGLRRRGRVARFLRRHALLAGGAAVCVLLAVVAATLMWLRPHSNEPGDVAASAPAGEVSQVADGGETSTARQREALAAESAAYSAASQEISERLERLEALSDTSRFAHPLEGEFWPHAESFEVRLDRLQSDTFREFSNSSAKGEP
jgi:hypothetical protein